MTSQPHQLHICFLPMMAPGHMIPIIDIARQFARHGAKSTIITTPVNASQFSHTIQRDREQGLDIDIALVQFPSKESSLPEGCENLSDTTTPEMYLNFLKALDLLREPVGNIVREARPHCIVAGAFFWWATDLALELNIPRLTFYGSGFFPMCLYKSLKENKPYKNVESDCEEFVVPGVPGEIRLSRRKLPDAIIEEDKHPLAEKMEKIFESGLKSFGLIVNTFYELEPDYARHYVEVQGVKAWHVGPVSLFNKSNEDKAHRGISANTSDECLRWLDSKEPNSVVYVCFGSMVFLQTPQLREIASGLEASGEQFIWVVRENRTKQDETNMDWLFEDFQRKMRGRGLIVKNWAAQVGILEHGAVGGFVTHCGWNSVLEGVAAGVPMVTWPMTSEQFLNEKMVTEVLGVGVPVGAEVWRRRTDEGAIVKGEMIERAVGEVMGGEGRERMRGRAKELGDMAKKAVEEGGSSEIAFKCLMEEIRRCHC